MTAHPRRRDVTHVRMRDGEVRPEVMQAFECTRCGDVLWYSLPLRMEVWLAMSRVFLRVHRACRAQEPSHDR